ncbi:MAG: SNF2-related protein, partial [Thermomicrobiales bacterium]
MEHDLLPALRNTITMSERADFCVGYFNLRGWRCIDDLVERWAGGNGACCRLIVGMQHLPADELREAMSLIPANGEMDNQTASRLRTRMAQEFRDQLTLGAPNNDDEAGLRRLSRQLKAKKVVVKLFLRYPLHAKLYVAYRADADIPRTGYMGSSNLTFAGLKRQGELNVDVLDHDATRKLACWFEERWGDRLCMDISDDLARIIDTSWARENDPPPYHIYLKMAYHLSQEARAGLAEFGIPRELDNTLFDFQKAAVKIAAHHVKKRGGVLIGDVVGLGKTLMATTLARMFDDEGMQTLVICPKNLVRMWQDYVDRYVPSARVKSLSSVAKELPELRRYPIVLIDESQNLRNREGKRYKAILEYITQNESKCILLSATPYNKTYLDLAAQLSLFIPENSDLGIRPENILNEIGEIEFVRRHQCGVRTLKAFEKSNHADDWRELMRLYLVRRTRSFIRENYALENPITHRKYLQHADGTAAFFPDRVPRTIQYPIAAEDRHDQYAKLYSPAVENTVNALTLPRYGLGNYVAPHPEHPPTPKEAEVLKNLSLAGKRLMGFCRTNLFKRLESGGEAFVQSVERHILRNYVFLHAIEHDLPLPIGTQDADSLDARVTDEDADARMPSLFSDDDEETTAAQAFGADAQTDEAYRARAADIYADYADRYKRKFKWLRPTLFIPHLAADLRKDALALLGVRQE